MNIENKRGVSEIIGYILLIAIVIAISVLVYQWLKSFVPQNSLSCPDGVSISVINYNYSCSKNTLNLTLQNSGTFSISGYFIDASNNSNQQIATLDLTLYYNGSFHVANNAVYYYDPITGDLNPFNPGSTSGIWDNYFNLSKPPKITSGTLNQLQITPVRFVNLSGKSVVASCGNARIQLPIKCT